MSLTVTIDALEYIPFTDGRYDGMGKVRFHTDTFRWTCSANESQFKTRSGNLNVKIINPAGRLTDDQITIVESMTESVIKSMATRGGDNHAGKVMDYGKKDWNGDDAFDHLPARDDSQ